MYLLFLSPLFIVPISFLLCVYNVIVHKYILVY